MDENSKFGGIVFILFLLFLIIGGFFFTKYITNDDNFTKKKDNNVNNEYKIDKKKDYIYFENDKFISMEPDITYKDVVFNIKGAESINNTLKQEMSTISNSVKYISDNTLDPERELLYEEDNIFSAMERNYETYNYKEYVSLIVKDSDFNCYDGSLLHSVKSYVFNIETGKQLNNTDMLNKYNIELNNKIDDIKEHLKSKQSYIDEEGTIELIKIEDTINSLNDANNYALYIDKYGDLYISFIVKTNEVDYNETMRLN